MNIVQQKINYILGMISILFIVDIILLIYISVLESSFSFLIFNLLFILVGILLITSFKSDYIHSIFIFSFFVFIYGVNALAQYYYQLYVYDTWNIYKDETLFFRYTNDVAMLLSQNITFYDLWGDTKYSAMIGYIYPAGLIAFASSYIDQNGVLLQKFFILYIASFHAIFLYNIMRNFFTKKNSLYLTITFSLFSFMMFLSSLILRDLFVSLFYMFFFYIFLKKSSFKNMVILFFIVFISILLRPETGSFLLVFCILYIYDTYTSINKNQLKIVLLLIFIIICILFYIYYFERLLLLYDLTVIAYTTLVNEQASNNSLGLILYNLPYGLNYIVLTFFWQLQPFPFWSVFSKELINPITGVQYALAGFFWYFTVGVMLISIFKFRILGKINRKLLFLFLGSILYIVIISSIAPDFRRLIAVYPILYIVSAMGFIYYMKNKIKYIFYIIIFYLLLVCLYLILKFGM